MGREHVAQQAGLVNLTHGGGGNAAVSFYPHCPGFWWPRLPNTVGKDGSRHAGWKLFFQHTVRFSSVRPALTQQAWGQPKPHGHGSETTTGQAWDGAGKLGAGLRALQRGEGSAAQPQSQASPRHAWAEALTQQSLLALCCRPQSHAGALLAWGPSRARLHTSPKPPPLPQLRGEGRLARHMPHSLYFCLKRPGGSVPQIPPDKPTDPARQPPDISDAASPLKPPGAKGLGQISLN